MNTETSAAKPNTENKKKTEIGSLWIKKSKQGTSFLAGSLKDLDKIGTGTAKIVIFKNGYKEENSNQPDYRIYLSEETNQEIPTSKVAKPEKPATNPVADKTPANEDDEIPF